MLAGFSKLLQFPLRQHSENSVCYILWSDRPTNEFVYIVLQQLFFSVGIIRYNYYHSIRCHFPNFIHKKEIVFNR